MHTPMLAQESSWQVVLGPARRRDGGFLGRGGGKREIPTGENSQATVGAAAEP